MRFSQVESFMSWQHLWSAMSFPSSLWLWRLLVGRCILLIGCHLSSLCMPRNSCCRTTQAGLTLWAPLFCHGHSIWYRNFTDLSPIDERKALRETDFTGIFSLNTIWLHIEVTHQLQNIHSGVVPSCYLTVCALDNHLLSSVNHHVNHH